MTSKPKRKEITRWLSMMLMRDVFKVPSDPRNYWASEVTFINKLYEPGKPTEIRVDFVRFVPVNRTAGGIDQGEFICYEVKSCMDDFKSDHGHNLIGDKNYYVMTKELYDELLADDPYLKQLRPNTRYTANPGVYIPKDGDAITAGDYEAYCKDDFPQLVLTNPLKGMRDYSSLQCVRKASRNLRREYSNSEMLFSMMRSAGRDRKQYDLDWWRQ